MIPFITRAASGTEVELLRLAISTFCDGSGMLKDEGGASLPGWRDFERAVAEVLTGTAAENKGVFDVIVPASAAERDYGFSLKSKELARATAIADLATTGRVYMELSNSPAKFWKALAAGGFSEDDFRAQRHAEAIGATVLRTVEGWHRDAQDAHYRTTGRTVDLALSIFLVLSYSPPRQEGAREYQWHSFDLAFPDGIIWDYRSEKSLRGRDPAHPAETLVDWYGLSGGQLKYYPRASAARYSSRPFTLLVPPRLSILAKAARYWPAEFRAAGGTHTITRADVAAELAALALCVDEAQVQAILETARRAVTAPED